MGLFDIFKKGKNGDIPAGEKTEGTAAESRKRRNNKFIKSQGIAFLEHLPDLDADTAVKKDIDTICKRAIACLITTQLACDIQKGDFEESKKFFGDLLEKFQVGEALLESEKRLFAGNYSDQDVINAVWTYEAYWALVWALGLIDDIKTSNSICDCDKAVKLVSDCSDYEDFKSKCSLRSTDEILDMLDLYYRYHWACVEKYVRPATKIGKLNPGVVVERRKALEWLTSDEGDWEKIPLHT